MHVGEEEQCSREEQVSARAVLAELLQCCRGTALMVYVYLWPTVRCTPMLRMR